MFFSEFSTLAHLISGDDTYHLNIKTKYQDNDGDQPEIIYLNITIVKMMNHNQYQVETLELIYTLKTRTYSSVQKLKGFGSLLYGSIIKMLDDTYGYTWGCEIQ